MESPSSILTKAIFRVKARFDAHNALSIAIFSKSMIGGGRTSKVPLFRSNSIPISQVKYSQDITLMAASIDEKLKKENASITDL